LSLANTLGFIVNHPVNRQRKLQAVLRFVRWQLSSRLALGPIVYEWINGSRFIVRAGETGLTGNIYTGLHEFSDMMFVLHALRADDLFVDIGANVGSYTILACAAVGARGYAFEPVPGSYERLVENIRLNHLESRVCCVNTGIGKEAGVLTFTTDGDTTNHVLAEGETSANTLDVEVQRLDTALDGDMPVMLKIDVEGFETEVLEGAQETLKNKSVHAVVMELNGSGRRYGYDESLLLELMLDNDFRTYVYDPVDRNLSSLGGKNVSSGNTLFVRDEAVVRQRIRESPNVSVLGIEF
jgi:FkbM family methyltransferase